MHDDPAVQSPRRTVLSASEADRRRGALGQLRDVLAARGTESVIVGKHTLSLRCGELVQPSGPGDPELHVLAANAHHIVTADHRNYRFADGGTHLAEDATGAADRILSAGMRHAPAGQQPSGVADQDAWRHDSMVMGAGERALRRLRDEGVI